MSGPSPVEGRREADAEREAELPATTLLERPDALIAEWRRLRRAATVVALFTSPAPFAYLYGRLGWSLPAALLGTFATIVAFRGLVDVIARRLLPWPSMFGADPKTTEEDIVARRRAWYWRTRFRHWSWLALMLFALLVVVNLVQRLSGNSQSLLGSLSDAADFLALLLPQLIPYALIFPLLFVFNFLILFGPLLFFGIKQIRGYEPGDADWGVKLQDVRGQAEAKEEVARVVTLWQSGEQFEKAGGKHERGLLFLGAPGTGKTMLAKAIATNFNSPFVTIPGSGFAQTFIGMDVALVLYLVWKARRLARKWGGQCIVFIDEIDAVGMRRQTLGPAWGGMATPAPGRFEELCFFGPFGALTPTGDLVLETRPWRERLFNERAPDPPPLYPPVVTRAAEAVNRFMVPGMFGGGSLALNQLLVQMDGIDEPPFMRRFVTNRVNTFLDALYFIPRKVGGVSLRLPRPKPLREQIFFIGATNVPIDRLDPALIRPGRMGRHVWFRTPTKEDRKDIFDLYITKVAHNPELDSERRRDELARITNGYSPAMIEQVCSMALTYAHAEGRARFEWSDIVEAMTTVESGTAVRIEYVPEETRAVAIHEAGHAAAGHVYLKGVLSTRLSIRKRGASLGHHQAIETEERFSSWRGEEFAKLVWTLGAMAAERVFYSENSTGVGGDVLSATARAAWMVGFCAMAPAPVDVDGRLTTQEERAAAREEIAGRFEEIGTQIMNRSTNGSIFEKDPIAGVLSDRDKRRAVAGLLGQAYVAAHALIEHNRDKVEQIADELISRREIHGDEVVELLERVGLERPKMDPLDEGAWPKV